MITVPITTPAARLVPALWLLLLSGCLGDTTGDPGTVSDDGMTLAMPDFIVQSRAVDPDQVTPVASLDDGRTIPLTRSGNTWSGTINVETNTQHQLTVRWTENYQNYNLPLAVVTRNLTIGETGLDVTISSVDYATDFDEDQDGTSNLAERNDGTDPLSAEPPEPVNPYPGADLVIARVNPGSVPTINGVGAVYQSSQVSFTGEWSAATESDTSGNTLYIDNLMIDNGADQSTGEPLHRFAAMHDGTYIYLVAVSDDIGEHQANNTELWKDDSLEIFIDGDHSRESSYDDDDDRHFAIALHLRNSSTTNTSSSARARIQAGPNSADLPDSVVFATGAGTGPISFRDSAYRHDVYEIRIPIDDFDIDIGEPFGFEVQLNDDDNGGTRDAKWGWIHPARSGVDIDRTYIDPSAMGTAVLAE